MPRTHIEEMGFIKRLITSRELREMLNVSESTFSRILDRGEIVPVFGRRRKLLFDPDAVANFIAARQSLARAPPTPAVTTPSQAKRETKEWEMRQAEAAKRLQAHQENRGQRTSRTK
jgi:hypothetical protein